MADAILVLNAGSSSLKFSVFLDRERPEMLPTVSEIREPDLWLARVRDAATTSN